MSLLEVDAINTYYGESHALFDVSLRVEEGEVVALLGRNGAGKTTTMNTIMGVLAPRSGSVRVAGEDVTGMRPHAVANRSVQLVPDTRRIVKTITVEENLQLAGLSVKRPLAARTHLRTVSRARHAPLEHGPRAFGRRAANARDRARARFASRGSCCSTNRSKAWRR